MIKKTRRRTGKGHAAAHAASVDGTADVVSHDPDSELVDDTTETKTSTSTSKATKTQTSTSASTKSQKDHPEDQLEPWVDHITRAMQKADDLSAAS